MPNKVAPAFQAYKCQGALFRVLANDFFKGNGVHAYLITGEAGIGKKTLARLCAKALLCTEDEKPCGKCGACRRCESGTHQDMILLEREKDKMSIGTQAVRDMVSMVGRHSYEGGKRVVLIEDAEFLTPQAQNCFLKTLEEPFTDVVFLLVAKDAGKLLPTIVSRCRVLRLRPWEDEFLLSMLLERGIEKDAALKAVLRASGNPSKAVAWASDMAFLELRTLVMQNVFAVKSKSQVLAVANQMKDEKLRAAAILDTIEDSIRELLLVQTGCLGEGVLADYPVCWQVFAHEAQGADFSYLFDKITIARKQRENQVNWQVVFETLLINMLEEASKW
jgi:DNA polymerase III, delta'' subunit